MSLRPTKESSLKLWRSLLFLGDQSSGTILFLVPKGEMSKIWLKIRWKAVQLWMLFLIEKTLVLVSQALEEIVRISTSFSNIKDILEGKGA
jgi:hypothetical protein